MTGRSLPEWVGATADTRVPPRVVERVCEKYGDRCACCFQRLVVKGTETDHEIALNLWVPTPEAPHGNRESNLRPLCVPCHKLKTRLDNNAKAVTARLRKARLGLKKPSKFPNARAGKYKTKIGGGTAPRNPREI